MKNTILISVVFWLTLNNSATAANEESEVISAEQQDWEDEPAEKPEVKVERKADVSKTKRTSAKLNKRKDADNRSSWRCEPIPDEAFMRLGTDIGNAQEWHETAVEFIAEWGEKCPSFTALEKEFPPFLAKKKYSEKLAVLFELNRYPNAESLLSLARQDEYDRFVAQHEGKKKSPQAKKDFQERRQLMAARASGAQLLLQRKFPKLMKQRAEAHAIVTRFLREYETPHGDIREENTASLKAFVRGLSPDQKRVTRDYLREALRGREYPKVNLKASAKRDRSLASIEKAPSAAVQVMLWELQ